jgi:flagellar biosynthetic protein FliP
MKRVGMKSMTRVKVLIFVTLITLVLMTSTASAQPQVPVPRFSIGVDAAQTPQDVVDAFEILGILTVLALAPSILIMMTSFTRIIIVLSFVRNALGIQQLPPNQILVGLALFLTFFVMAPIGTQIHDDAVIPYLDNRIEQQEALNVAMKPIREFMLRNTRESDMNLFLHISESERPETLNDIPTHVLIPAFIISELKTGFQIGFLIFLPFIVVDMVVASTLMSMGMMMLPPVMISLPFKILLFVLVDGWNLVIRNLVIGFN